MFAGGDVGIEGLEGQAQLRDIGGVLDQQGERRTGLHREDVRFVISAFRTGVLEYVVDRAVVDDAHGHDRRAGERLADFHLECGTDHSLHVLLPADQVVVEDCHCMAGLERGFQAVRRFGLGENQRGGAMAAAGEIELPVDQAMNV